MPDVSTGRLLTELEEALEITDDDLLYVVRVPYSALTNLKLKASTLKAYIFLAAGTGDIVGPAGAVENDIATFDSATGKLVKDSGFKIVDLLNRANHSGQQAFDTINVLPSTLAGHGIIDGALKIAIDDNGVAVTEDLRRLNLVGFTITPIGGATQVEVTPGAAGAPASATYITQTPNGTLSNEQALSALATGLLKVTTITGALTTADPETDYIAVPAGSAEGDIIYRGPSSWGRLAKGTVGQVLRYTSTALIAGNPTAQGIIALTDAATILVDATLFSPGKMGSVTITNNRTLDNPTGAIDGQELQFRIREDAVGGWTCALGSKYRFTVDFTTFVPTAAANKITYLTVRYSLADDKFDVVRVTH
jgi:hypothetical protein